MFYNLPVSNYVIAGEPTCAQMASYWADVDPWNLKEPVVLGDKTDSKAAKYYKNVVLVGYAMIVEDFIGCHGLSVKGLHSFYFKQDRPLWAVCVVIPIHRGGPIVCVATDENGNPLDSRVTDPTYTKKVTSELSSH